MAMQILWNVMLLCFVEVSKDRRPSLRGSGSTNAPTFLDSLTLMTRTLILLETWGTIHRPTQLHIPVLDTNQRQKQIQRSLKSSCCSHDKMDVLNSACGCWTDCYRIFKLRSMKLNLQCEQGATPCSYDQ